MNKQERYFLLFFTGHTKFLQQRQSLTVSAAGRSISRNSVVVSTACTRSRGPTRGCRARLRGRATRARARRNCIIVRRDTCHVANVDNAHLTTSNSILCSVLCALCAIMLIDANYAQNCAGIMYASLLGWLQMTSEAAGTRPIIFSIKCYPCMPKAGSDSIQGMAGHSRQTRKQTIPLCFISID